MKKLIALAAVLSFGVSTSVFAADCEAQATEKKLAGAAKNSFMKKCMRDAGGSCADQAATKKLAGAAKNSFMKKCEADAGK